MDAAISEEITDFYFLSKLLDLDIKSSLFPIADLGGYMSEKLMPKVRTSVALYLCIMNMSSSLV